MYRRPLRRSGVAEALQIAGDVGVRAWGAMRVTPGLLLISLLLGFALWVSVSDVENPTRIDAFPASVDVEAVNLDPALAVANRLQDIDLTVAAPEDRWRQLTSDHFRALVDLNGLKPGEQMVPVQLEVRGISGVRIVRSTPATVLVNLEPLTTKEVRIATRLVGAVPLGYEVTKAEPASPAVTVSGPASLVNLVAEATAEVNVTGRTVGLGETAQLIARGEGGGEIRGVRLEPPSTRVEVSVVQSVLRRQLPLNATFAGEPAAGHRVTSVTVDPSSVSLEGPIDVLQSLDRIDLQPIDAGGQQANIVRSVPVPVPKGARNLGQTNATVTVQIEAITGTVRFAIPVTAINVPAGGRAQFADPAVVVLLAGNLPVLNAINPEDLRATVDLATVPLSSTGPTSVPVTLRIPDGTRIVSVQPEAVSVTITYTPTATATATPTPTSTATP